MKVQIGFTQITGLTAVQTFATGSLGAIPAGAMWAEFTVTGQDVRMRDDGTNPDATHGLLYKVNTTGPYTYFGPLSKPVFIQAAPTAVIDVVFYGVRSKQ